MQNELNYPLKMGQDESPAKQAVDLSSKQTIGERYKKQGERERGLSSAPQPPLPPTFELRHLDLKGLSLSMDLEGLCALSDHFPLERSSLSFLNIPNCRYCEIKTLTTTNFDVRKNGRHILTTVHIDIV